MRPNSATGLDPAEGTRALPAGEPLAFLFVATTPPVDDESWLLATARALLDRGHRVAIATVRGTSLATRPPEPGLTVLTMRPGRRFNLRARWRARAIRKRHQFDLAITFDPTAFEIARSIAVEPTPLVWRASAVDSSKPARRCLTHSRLTALWLVPGAPPVPELADIPRRAARRAAPAALAVRVLTDAVTIPSEPLDPTATRRELRLPRRVVLGLHVAPLERGYGHETILRALQELQKSRRPLPTVAFLGTGPEESRLHVLCQDLGVKENVLWLGFRRDTEPFVHAADFVLAPEASANTRSVLLAAQAAGVQVLAADTAVAEECSPAPGGLRIASTAPKAWAEVIAQVLADRADLADPAALAAVAARSAAARRAAATRANTHTAAELECAVHAARLQRAGFADRAPSHAENHAPNPAANRGARRPALFLDRDGTLVENVPYNADPTAVVLEPRVGRALRWARDAGFALVVVTNQSALARGLCTEADVQAVNDRMRDLLRAEGCELDGVYVCPHHPDFGPACDCRKPAPGLLQRAARDLHLDLTRSVLVGDSERDMEAARRAGVRPLFYRNPSLAIAPGAELVPAGVQAHDDWLALVRQLLADTGREFL